MTSPALQCLANGIEVQVDGKVSTPPWDTATQAKISLVSNGAVLSEQVGPVNEWISQQFLLPADQPGCYSGG